jgi:hypothetical protein
MASSLVNQPVPVNRALVGWLAIGCGVMALVMAVTGIEGSAALWQGAFSRVGVVLAAFWLALPSRTRDAAWARIPLWNVAGLVLVLLAVARLKVPLKVLLPMAVVFGIGFLLLRPRVKARPTNRLFE